MRLSPSPGARARRRRAQPPLVALAAALALCAAAAAPAEAGPDGATAGATLPAGVVASGSHDVTLLTGDVVHVRQLADGSQTVSVTTAEPGDGVQLLRQHGDLLVLPDSAARYVASGALDLDLFDVTTLIADGYDDASTDALPLIVQYRPGADRARTAPHVPGLDVGRALSSIHAAAATADRDEATRTWAALAPDADDRAAADPTPDLAPGIAAVHLDGKVKAELDSTVPWIGAPSAWAAGLDGAGVTVAVLDTGYDDTHPDLAGHVLPGSRSFVPGEAVDDDPHGHGTHVTSTIVGSGAASGGRYKGVAPGASVLMGKVLGADGYGQDSWIIEGMEWAAANAKVVSMSLGSQEPSDGSDPMSQALAEISARTGALFVVAAGNSGAPGTVSAPAASPAALTVGSVDDPSGSTSWFSSQGPVVRTGALKPDIAGPGNDVTAARSADSPGSGAYVSMSGTSMATPHVAGAAAIVLEQHPDYTGDELRAALTSSARDLALSSYAAGAGVVDVAAAVAAHVVASGSGDFGQVAWGTAPAPVSRTVTYTNRGADDVTLDLAATLTDVTPPSGGGGGPGPLSAGALGADAGPATLVPAATSAVPDGLLTQSAQRVAVPAGGTATVTLTADPSVLSPGQQVSGALVARVDGTPVARTALGVLREAELYDLTLDAADFAGAPASTVAYVWNATTRSLQAVPVEGTATLRLPPGQYSVMSFLQVPRTPDTLAAVLVGNPGFTLDRATTVALDARKANPVELDLGKKRGDGLAPQLRRMDYTAVGGQSGSYLASVLVDELWVQPQSERDGLSFTTRWRMVPDPLTVDAAGFGPLDVIPQVGSATVSGELRARAADGGAGTPEELGGVRGKIAVITRSADLSAYRQATNAAAAGASAVLLVDDADGEFSQWVGDDDYETQATLPVIGVSGVQGRALLAQVARRTVVLAVHGSVPDTVYDLDYYTSGTIPADPTYRPGPLARIDTTYFGSAGSLGAEFRYDFAPGVDVGLGLQFALPLAATRTEWVSTDQHVEWYQDASQLDTGWEVRDVRRGYTPGSTRSSSYFGPIVRPYVGPGYWAPYRSGSGMQVNIPAAADGQNPQRTGAFDVFSGSPAAGSETVDVYVDGHLKASSPYQSANVWDMPDGDSAVRVVATTHQDGNPSSTDTSTEWTFTSRYTRTDFGSDMLPLLQASYDAGVDVSGQAGAGRAKGARVPLVVEVGHIDGAVGAAPVTGATLEVRVGAGEWTPVPLTELAPGPEAGASDWVNNSFAGFTPGRQYVRGWRAELPVPDAGGWVSTRVTGTDSRGSTVSQEIERAFHVAPAKGVPGH